MSSPEFHADTQLAKQSFNDSCSEYYLYQGIITTMRQFMIMWQNDLVQVAHFIKLSLGRVYTDLDTVNI